MKMIKNDRFSGSEDHRKIKIGKKMFWFPRVKLLINSLRESKKA